MKASTTSLYDQKVTAKNREQERQQVYKSVFHTPSRYIQNNSVETKGTPSRLAQPAETRGTQKQNSIMLSRASSASRPSSASK